MPASSPSFSSLGLTPTCERVLMRSAEHPASATLFVDRDAASAREIVLAFARAIFLLPPTASNTSHPDLVVFERESEARELGVVQVRSLLVRAMLSSARGGLRVFAIPEADRLNEEAANALLKLVEEPPRGLVWVFGASRPDWLPATLRSRLTMIRVGRIARTATQDRRDIQITTQSPGIQLQSIEQLAKSCEAQDDPASAWREAIATSMSSLRPLWLKESDRATHLAMSYIRAWSLADTTLSPRLALEFAAVSTYPMSDEDLPSFFHPSYL